MKQDDVSRKCIVTGEIIEKNKLLRFTVTPDNQVIPDFKRKLPGKGIYTKNSQKCLKTAIEKNLFSKVTKKQLKADHQLMEIVESLLRKKGLDAVSLARKAGILITGMDKVIDALKKNKVAFILEAKGAGEDGHQRILIAARDLEIFNLYDVEELDKALDKVNTVHVAFLKSEMAKTVYNEFSRLQSFLNS